MRDADARSIRSARSRGHLPAPKSLAGYTAIDTAVCCACASTSIVFPVAVFAAPTAYLALPVQLWFLGVTVPASVDVDMETGETDQRIAGRRDVDASDHQQVVFAY